MWSFVQHLLCAPLLLSLGNAAIDSTASDDLTSFITRPEIKAPKFQVTQHNKDLLSSGYWFVAPYPIIVAEVPTKKYTPCQVGPHIYDSEGSLVWSGACLWDNRNVFDFKVTNAIGGRPHLTFILQREFEGEDRGAGLILDERYEHKSATPVTNDLWEFNIHEFRVLEGGNTALVCAYRTEELDLNDIGMPGQAGFIMTGGIEEIDVATGNILFEWRALDHIPLSHSDFYVPTEPPRDGPGWDYIHLNSVDKNDEGNYLVSARFTNSVYLISGQDGHIIWRMGGMYSDFEQDFSFYRQHDAQFVVSNSTHTVISVLDNASDEGTQREGISAALYISLDTTSQPMRATLTHRYSRPDGDYSRLRGNVQTLPNGNVFVGWSQQGYQSEFASDGTLAMEAQFVSDRFSTYRAYKYDFFGMPTEPPIVKSFAYGSRSSGMTTVIYVSWNGATEVASYRFFAKASPNRSPVLIGNVSKSGFETMFIASGYMDWVSAEAVDAEGNVLSRSDVAKTTVPDNWLAAEFLADLPVPDDPMTVEVNDANQDADQADPHGSHGTTYTYTPDFSSRILAPIGAFTVLLLFGAALVGLFAVIRRAIGLRRLRHYKEVPKNDFALR